MSNIGNVLADNTTTLFDNYMSNDVYQKADLLILIGPAPPPLSTKYNVCGLYQGVGNIERRNNNGK